MTWFCIVIYNDDKIYTGEMVNGLMDGYREFYWENKGKKILWIFIKMT